MALAQSLPSELPPTLPFLLHALLETPASINFFFRPSSTLAQPSPHAHAVIRQYAFLLLTSVVIAVIFALREIDDTSRLVAAALSIYHAAPMVRAGGKILFGEGGEESVVVKKGEKKTSIQKGTEKTAVGQLGGPWVHFVTHGGVFAALILFYLTPVPASPLVAVPGNN